MGTVDVLDGHLAMHVQHDGGHLAGAAAHDDNELLSRHTAHSYDSGVRDGAIGELDMGYRHLNNLI